LTESEAAMVAWDKLDGWVASATSRGRELFFIAIEAGRTIAASRTEDVTGFIERIRLGPVADDYATGFRDGIVHLLSSYQAQFEPGLERERLVRLSKERNWLSILRLVRTEPLIQKDIGEKVGLADYVVSEELKRLRDEKLLFVSLDRGRDRRLRPHRLSPLGEEVLRALEDSAPPIAVDRPARRRQTQAAQPLSAAELRAKANSVACSR